MTRLRIGLALSQGAARMVVLEGGAVLRVAETIREPSDTVLDTLRMLLEGHQELDGRGHPALSVALGASLSRVKHLSGLPPLGDPELTAAVVSEGRGTFFLADPSQITTTGVQPDGSTGAWAAALDRSVVEQVRDATRALGFRLTAVAPVAAVLPLVLPGPTIRWDDGPIRIEIEVDEGHLNSVRTSLRYCESGSLPTEAPLELVPFGEGSVRLVDALGAALLTGTEPLCVGHDGRPFQASSEARRRLLVPVAISGLAAVALLLSPLRSEIDARRAEAELRVLEASPRWEVAAKAYDQLTLATEILQDIREFEASRRLRGPTLAALARSLPADAVMRSVEMNDAGAVISAFTLGSAAGLAASLRGQPGIGPVEVLGPLKREVMAGTEMASVTLRLGPSADETSHAGSVR